MRRLGAPPPPPPPKKIEDLASLNKFDKHTFLGVSMPMHYHQFIVLISPIIKLKFLGGGGGVLGAPSLHHCQLYCCYGLGVGLGLDTVQ